MQVAKRVYGWCVMTKRGRMIRFYSFRVDAEKQCFRGEGEYVVRGWVTIPEQAKQY